ncbi:MAG: NAD-dependent epimerase/dehydratase family protein [Bacteroidia bacterium]|jgi:uncharacterized protein YbjT (DUF2867 family)
MEQLKVIITGSTGMVGEGVLHVCLNNDRVSEILVINRKPCGYTHAKLKEIIHTDFFNLESIQEQFRGYNACFFCLGVTSIGKDEEVYTKFTHTLTLNFATAVSAENSGMTFIYVSGAGTDSTEKGKSMWARVKGKTENDLKKLPFKHVYLFRPGYIQPIAGMKYTHAFYHWISWMYPAFRLLFGGFTSTLEEIGKAMIGATVSGYEKPVLEVKDINRLGKG